MFRPNRHNAFTAIVVIAAVGLASASFAIAQPAESQIGAWRYSENKTGGASGYRAVVASANKKASFGFACDRPGSVSIHAFLIPGEPLGVPSDGAFKKGLSYQVDNSPSITKDWFYPDESKGETEVTKTVGVDSFDVLNAVRKGQKTVRLRASKADGKTLELSFDISGANAALTRLVADCKSAEYK